MSGAARHASRSRSGRLLVARTWTCTEKLGPGRRSVVWLQGCHLRCRGCVASETWSLEAGEQLPVGTLAESIASTNGIEGVTFSGGEPFLQAEDLCDLIDSVRGLRPELTYMSYSGYRREWLASRNDHGFAALLDRLDILIDGPYVERLNDGRLWRGSSNQRIHLLTGRHEPICNTHLDRSVGIEMALNPDGIPIFIGVPGSPDVVERLAMSIEATTNPRSRNS